MNLPLRSTLALALILAAGCASGRGTPDPERPLGVPAGFTFSQNRVDAAIHSTVIDAPLERVAEVVPEAYELLGLPAERADDTSRLTFRTPNLRIEGRLYEGERNSAYFDCGSTMSGPRADTYELRFRLATTLRPDEAGGTVVETLLYATARDRYASTAPVSCLGTGKLGEEVARALRRRVAG